MYSSLNLPVAIAYLTLSYEIIENSSYSSLVSLRSLTVFSAQSPIATLLNISVNPSYANPSTSYPLPNPSPLL